MVAYTKKKIKIYSQYKMNKKKGKSTDLVPLFPGFTFAHNLDAVCQVSGVPG